MSSRGRVASLLARRMPLLYRVVSSLTNPANRGHRARAVGRTVRYDVNTRLLKRPTYARLGERSRIVSYPGETNSPHAVYRNPPNYPEMMVWRRYLQAGDLFVDVGANIGVYTIWALDCGAEVIAVEPDARSAARIREHLAMNGYTATVVEHALSDHPGNVHMTTDLDSLNHLTDDGGVEVEATTLDTILGNRTAAGVKIDVEGAEALVLAGGGSALKAHRIQLIQMEWGIGPWMVTDQRHDVRDLLLSHDYELCVPGSEGELAVCYDPPPFLQNVFARPRQMNDDQPAQDQVWPPSAVE